MQSLCSAALPALLLSTPALAAPLQGMAPVNLEALGTVRDDAHVFMSFAMGDAREWVSHPKDAGLARALAMLDDRLADLPIELGNELPGEVQFALDPAVMPVWLRLLQAPKSVSLGASASLSAESGNAMALGFALHEEDAAAAQRLHGQIMDIAAQVGAEMPPGLIQLEDRSLAVRAGLAAPAPGWTQASKLVGDMALVEELSIDVGAFVDFMGSRIQNGDAPPDAQMVLGILERLGLHELRIDVAVGTDGAKMRSVSVGTGIGKNMREAGILPEGSLQAAHLAPIPADATMATVQRIDMRATFEALNAFAASIMAEQGMGDEADLGDIVASTTGIDLREDLFGALGKTVGIYASDTTGGGGLTSTVMFMEVADADALTDTKETIEELVNALAMGPLRGYVSFRTWEDAEVEYTTLMFPGLPVPLELTMAMSDAWIVMGTTPTAARGAMHHIQSGGASLATRPDVTELLAGGDRHAISFMDTAYYARIGYGPTSLMMSAVANGVRSPIDATRDPGPIMPTYAQFKQGIAPTLGYTTVRGDDMVTISEGDGSMIVGLAAAAGLIQEYGAALMVPVLAAAGGEEVAREFGFRF